MSNLFISIVDFLQDQLRQTSTYKEVMKTASEVKQAADEQITQIQIAYAKKKASEYLPFIAVGIILYLILRK